MATIGIDAEVLLWHASLNGGAAVGFLLNHDDEKELEKAITIERTNWYSTEGGWIERTKIILQLALADQQMNPDGSIRMQTLAEQYADYLELRGLVTNLGLGLPNLTITGLHLSAFACRERHFGGRIDVTVILNSGNWPETVKLLEASTLVEAPVAAVYQAGSWWFNDPVHSGQILTW